MKKRILAALLALGCALLVFTGCGSKKDTTPKDYTQIIHDAREAEDNEYEMIFTKGRGRQVHRPVRLQRRV